MTIRQTTDEDWDAIWAIWEPIVRAGETYTYPRDTDYDTARRLWMETPQHTYIAQIDNTVVGTYYIKPNQPGGGSHVCNCGYMVAPAMRGKGIARAMCDHSLNEARRLGYRAMQFNFVIATNITAIALWERCGFETVGRLPGAFHHPVRGYVDALVMYKDLTGDIS